MAFLDIKLPEVRGTEVLRRVREMGIETPIIMITAYGTVKNAVECTHLGAVAYIQKPFSADKILSVLQELNPGLTSECHSNSIEKYISQVNSLINESLFNEAIVLPKPFF